MKQRQTTYVRKRRVVRNGVLTVLLLAAVLWLSGYTFSREAGIHALEVRLGIGKTETIREIQLGTGVTRSIRENEYCLLDCDIKFQPGEGWSAGGTAIDIPAGSGFGAACDQYTDDENNATYYAVGYANDPQISAIHMEIWEVKGAEPERISQGEAQFLQGRYNRCFLIEIPLVQERPVFNEVRFTLLSADGDVLQEIMMERDGKLEGVTL